MLSIPFVVTALAAYVMLLGVTAWWADRAPGLKSKTRFRATLYSLSLAALCSSRTYFGAVGDARNGSWLYFANALGPILGITLGYPVWRRIALLSKQENVGLLADFLAARYGKSRSLGTLATCVATLGALPYVSLQLIGLARAWTFALGTHWPQALQALVLMAVLTAFAILFGTRRPSLTQHSRGLVGIVAIESCVKLGALFCTATLCVLILTRAPAGLSHAVAALPPLLPALNSSFLTLVLLCTATAFTLPRPRLSGSWSSGRAASRTPAAAVRIHARRDGPAGGWHGARSPMTSVVPYRASARCCSGLIDGRPASA